MVQRLVAVCCRLAIHKGNLVRAEALCDAHLQEVLVVVHKIFLFQLST